MSKAFFLQFYSSLSLFIDFLKIVPVINYLGAIHILHTTFLSSPLLHPIHFVDPLCVHTKELHYSPTTCLNLLPAIGFLCLKSALSVANQCTTHHDYTIDIDNFHLNSILKCLSFILQGCLIVFNIILRYVL